MCQPMPTGLYTCSEFNADLQRFKPQSNKTRPFENMLMGFFQKSRPDCKIGSFFTIETQRKIDSFSVGGFCSHCNTIFEALLWVASITFANLRKSNLVLQMKTLRREKEREKEKIARMTSIFFAKKKLQSLRCGSVSWSSTCARIRR